MILLDSKVCHVTAERQTEMQLINCFVHLSCKVTTLPPTQCCCFLLILMEILFYY